MKDVGKRICCPLGISPPSPSRRVKQEPSSLGKCQTGAGSNFFHEQSGCSRLSIFIHRESGRNEPRDGEGMCSMQRRAELQQVNGVYWCETGLTGTVALVPISVSGAGAWCNSRPHPPQCPQSLFPATVIESEGT